MQQLLPTGGQRWRTTGLVLPGLTRSLEELGLLLYALSWTTSMSACVGPLNSLTDETTTQLCETDTHPDQSQFKQSGKQASN